MTTRELIARLPQNVMERIDGMKKTYRAFHPGERTHEETRLIINAYITGLKDAGLITEHERRILYNFATL